MTHIWVFKRLVQQKCQKNNTITLELSGSKFYKSCRVRSLRSPQIKKNFYIHEKKFKKFLKGIGKATQISVTCLMYRSNFGTAGT